MVVAALLLAGCAAPAEETQQVDHEHGAVGARAADAERRPITLDEAQEHDLLYGPKLTVGIEDEVVFAGELSADDLAACDGACLAVRFGFDVPAAYEDGWVDIRIHWNGTTHPGFDLDVAGAEVRRGFDMSRAVIWGGDEAEVSVDGIGAFAGTARYRHVDLPAVPGGDLLPDLVTLTPVDVYIDGCLPEERLEDGARRCLRLGNSVGNVGDGPLEVHLDHEDGALSVAGAGEFVQRIYTADGHRDKAASGAELHLVHGHFHYAGLAHFALYAYNTTTGLRGEEVAEGAKRGFCFLDWGDMESPEAPSEGGQRAEQACLVPSPLDGWSMGISRGHYDYYGPGLADQYIDIPDVPDGTYELVSIADGADTLAESDETDNVASLLIRIRGDQVTVLEERALYDNPEQA